MDYNRNECQAVVENSEDNLFNLRPSTGVAFFEAICLRGLLLLFIVNCVAVQRCIQSIDKNWDTSLHCITGLECINDVTWFLCYSGNGSASLHFV